MVVAGEVDVVAPALVVVVRGTAVVVAARVVVEAIVEVVVSAAAVVVGGAVVLQPGAVKELLSSDTWPLSASARPSTAAPEFTVTDASASTVPLNTEVDPSVAELPTCQNTLQACAPLIRLIALPEAVVSDEPIWKMNTELGSPMASSVRVPESASELFAV